MYKFKAIPIDSEPENLEHYPDFLISRLIRNGSGVIEGCKADGSASGFCWIYRPRGSSERVPIGSQVSWKFRHVLARFAFRCEDHNPYGDTSIFQVDDFPESERHSYSFALYTCNEPAMDFWAKLYLYSIVERKGEI